MKIVYIDNFLVKHGFTPTIGNELATLLSQEGLHIIKASSHKNKLLRLLSMLWAIFVHRKDSVVLITTYSGAAFYFAVACGLLCKVLNIRYIPCLHGGNLPERIQKSPKISNMFFANSYLNVAVSDYLAKTMLANNWKVKIIPNVIHKENYPFLLRRDIAPVFLWVRSFHKIYNPILAIDIIHQVKKDFPSVRLYMVGPDKDGSLDLCKKKVKELALEDNIMFKGLMRKEEWIDLSAKAAVFFNTTNFDNLPVSLIEAMALGMPIISTNVGGIPYLIEHEKNGFLVEVNDINAFVHYTFRLLSNPLLTEKISQNARNYAEKFDWSHVKKQWLSILNLE